MGGFVLIHQHKGLILISFGFHPVKGEVSDHIGGIPDMLDDLIVLTVAIHIQTHWWVVVGTLADENFRVVVSLRGHVRAEMPFAHHRGGVACLLEKLGEGLLGSVELVSINQKPVGVRILTGLDGGPHGSADRVGDIAPVSYTHLTLPTN